MGRNSDANSDRLNQQRTGKFSDNTSHARRRFIECFAMLGLSSTLLPGALWAKLQESKVKTVTPEMVRAAAELAGLEITDAEYKLIAKNVNKNLSRYREMRQTHLDNSVPPPLYFNPLVPGMTVDRTEKAFRVGPTPTVRRPAHLEEVAFWPLTHLAELVKTRQVRSTELTEMYLRRLERFNPKLNCVVTLTESLAREQAKQADAEIAAGRYKGPLHGIPYGAKDIIAVKGYPTTWGAEPYKNRYFYYNATVIDRLTAAGAVLVAKLSTGEFAFGDTWFRGRTNNPWDTSEGSSGSSAGSASATAAGLVGYALGTDTGGSILSPSTVCGVVGLRPTFGRVSRHGVMAAGFSLDKVGVLCRGAEDCALVLHAMAGPDGKDLAVPYDIPFNWDGTRSIKGVRVGYLAAAFDREKDAAVKANGLRAVESLRSLGMELKSVDLPENDLNYFIESAERGAGFDDFMRSDSFDLLQLDYDRAMLLSGRLIPAVEYLQANRIRMLLMEQVAKVMSDLDVILAPYDAINPLTSSTGNPVVAVPSGFRSNGTPTAITFVGQIYREGELLAVARAYQNASGLLDKHPAL